MLKGAPYKFAVKQESRGFDQAPEIILNAVNRLTWAGQQAVGDDFTGFNELLAVGYFETGEMNVRIPIFASCLFTDAASTMMTESILLVLLSPRCL